MSDTAATTRMTQIGPVFVPVADHDRALEFYVGKLGFEKRADYPYGDFRWVEVAPPGAAIAIALVPPGEGGASDPDRTHCAFSSGDIDADHAALRGRGVDVDAAVAREGAKRGLIFDAGTEIAHPVSVGFFFFRDDDGNRFLMVEGG